MSTLAIVILIIVLSFLLQASFYWLGAKIVKAGRPTWSRTAAVTAIVAALGVLNFVLAIMLTGEAAANPERRAEAILGLLFIIQVPLLIYLMKRIYQTSFLRGLFVWFMGMLAREH
jgi:hypothetical protein